MTLTVGSLFSGIGGLDLGLERAGMDVIWQSEIDPYACRVLNKHWPKVVNHGNIKEIDWTRVERPDVICGGYPCQPFSTAGQRKGEQDPRHLWPWVRECISVLRPRYAILENVRGHLSLGGTTVIREIASLGYCVEWRVISAASVGANHRRDRVVLLAYPNNTRSHTTPIDATERGKPTFVGFGGRREDMADTNDGRYIYAQEPQEPNIGGRGENEANDGRGTTKHSRVQSGTGNISNTEGVHGNERGPSDSSKAFRQWQEMGGEIGTDGSTMANTEGGYVGSEEPYGLCEIFGQATKLREPGSPSGTLGRWWQVEPNVGRVAYGVPARVDRLRGLGNAVVPQVAEIVGRLVMAHANATK
jgi:DNA (cytosine-5)-methyltransferase 1